MNGQDLTTKHVCRILKDDHLYDVQKNLTEIKRNSLSKIDKNILKQVKLTDVVTGNINDKKITNEIDCYKQVKNFLSKYKNTQNIQNKTKAIQFLKDMNATVTTLKTLQANKAEKVSVI